MQPVTVPLHMPALAINQPFQHSVLPPSRTATAEIRPQSEQPLQAYHRMPTARLLPVVVMPHSLMYCSYPQPAPPHMPAPTTQQSVPVPCYTPTDQPTAEIRPQPEQPPQAYHESSTTGQIPGAPMTLHFPMHSCPQPTPPHMPASTTQQSVPVPCYTPTDQPTAEIRPQPEQPLQAYHESSTTGQIPGAPMTSHFPVYPYPQPAPPYMPEPTTQQPFQQSVSTPYYIPIDQPTAEIRPQPGQPLQAYHEALTTGQIPGAPMTSHFPVYPYPQPAPPYMPEPTTQQPFQQSVSTPYYIPIDQPTAEIRPQPGQPLQAYHEALTTGQIPGAPMTSHFPVYPYPQPATPHMPEPTTQQPFQQSVSTPYYIPIDQPTAEIRPQPGQPLQAYHEALTTGQIPGAPMTSHFPVNPYAPQLPVYGQIQQKWQPVYQQPYESQSTVSPESRVNYSFNSGTQSLSEIPRNL